MQSRFVHSIIYSLLVVLAFAWARPVAAQKLRTDYYTTTEDETNDWGWTTATYNLAFKLNHSTSHWYDSTWRDEYETQKLWVGHTSDTFDSIRTAATITAPSGETVQNIHTYIDTIYAKKGGDPITLTLPGQNGSQSDALSASYYVRWYDYRTGKTLSYQSGSNYYELLYPQRTYKSLFCDASGTSGTGYYGGYIVNPSTYNTRDLANFYFYYPTDSEASSWGFSNSNTNYNESYMVACDIGPYVDGDLSYTTSGSTRTYTITEPTLSQRVIYYISGISSTGSEIGLSTSSSSISDNEKKAYDNEHFWNFIKNNRSTNAATSDVASKKYYTTYEISFPFTRFDEAATEEMVALNKSVEHYYAPGAGSSMTVTLVDHGSGITLTGASSGSTSYTKSSGRAIQFNYPTTKDDGTQEVKEENSTADIYVTNDQGDGIVHFNITFTKGQRLFTQTEIASIEKGEVPSTLPSLNVADYTKRTPSYLKENYELVTSLDMNYNSAAEDLTGVTSARSGETVASSDWSRLGTGTYPFPMAWTSSQYGFKDGSKVVEAHTTSVTTSNDDVTAVSGNFIPVWSEYGFVNKYIYDDKSYYTTPMAETLPNGDAYGTNEDNYWLYIDAAAEPGIIARIPFRSNLCTGSELFMTGWAKSAVDAYESSAPRSDAAILMSVVAAHNDKDGNTLEEKVLTRHSTGMIPRTALCERYGGSGEREKYDSTNKIPFKTGATEEWVQFYYSFVLPDNPFSSVKTSEGEEVTYYLELQNNVASAAGADYYLDDICIYMANPTVTVTQVTPTCSSFDTRMQIKLDYDMTVSRFGLQDQTTLDAAKRVDVNFVIIDSENYATKEKTINDRTDITDTEKNVLREEAFKSCRVKFGFLNEVKNSDGTTSTKAGTLEQRQTMVFYNSYLYMQGHTDGTETGALDTIVRAQYYYDDTKRGYNTAYTPAPTTDTPNPYPRWRIITEGDKRYLVTDISVGDGNSSTAIQAGRVYTLVMASSYDASSSSVEGGAAAADQVSVYDAYVNPCGYKRSFTPQGSVILQTTGQIVTPDMSFCTGQINNFTAKLRIYKNGEQVDIVDGYFDWFFDDEEKYNAVNETYGVSLKDALFQLRQIYPDLTLTQLDTLQAVKKGSNEITENMIKLIKYYTEQESEEFLNPMLVLHEQAANMRISLADGEIVVYPSPITITDAAAMACFDPIPITFTVEGTAPELHLGYDGENYPVSVQAGLRLGLTQIKNHTTTPIILPLRGVDMGDTKTEGVDHLGIVQPTTADDGTTKGSDLSQIYLVSTDDPFFNIKQDGQYSNPIGTLDKLFAVESTNTRASDNTLQFHFNTTFTDSIHEGYTYNVKIWFGEVDADDKVVSTKTEETSTECYGSVVIPIRIVPEYLRWAGSSTDNWNNDDHWKRSRGEELYKNSELYTASEHYDGAYVDYNYETLNTVSRSTADYKYKGFVPMNFSYVTIPDSAQVELYAVSAKTSGGTILNLAPTTKPSTILSATKNIEYDLVYKEKTASSSDDDPHTEPYYSNTVKQVHFRPAAEMLHTEYLNYSRAWVDMKLPTAEWSLVSTPFAKTYSGEFYTTPTDGLQQTELFLPITFTGAGVTYDRFAPAIYLRSYVGSSARRLESSSDETGTLMAMTGRWSGVYNKVNRALAIGQAFSVKPVKGNADGVGDSVIVRLPKGDDSYYYYEDGSSTGSQNTTVSKEETNGTTRYSLAAYDGILPDGATTAQTFTTSLTKTKEIEAVPTSATLTDQWYILGNPFVSHLNLTEFFKANTAFDASTYMTAEGVATTVTSSTLIPPLSAFYARLVGGATLPSTLSYTADMEALRATSTTTSGVRGLRLTATVEGHATHAYVITDASATADYQAGEDYGVFVPDADDLACPVVYTVAGNVATTVNRTATLSNIPIGLIGGENDDEVSVRFDFEGIGAASSLQASQSKQSKESKLSRHSPVSPVSNFSNVSTEAGETGEATLSLYDAVLSTTTPLEPGSVVTLQANAHGRYFLNLGAAPVAETNISIYSANRELVVSSTADPLTRVEVYTPDGRRVLTAAPSATTFTTQLPMGIYIVRAATSEQQARGKVRL